MRRCDAATAHRGLGRNLLSLALVPEQGRDLSAKLVGSMRRMPYACCALSQERHRNSRHFAYGYDDGIREELKSLLQV